jgi:hypothetical protein
VPVIEEFIVSPITRCSDEAGEASVADLNGAAAGDAEL